MAFGIYANVNGERKNIINWQGIARPYSDGQANAHILAASWELYEALERSTAMLRTLVPKDISVRETLAEHEVILAKARGEQP
jgi:hypothetical protein